MRFSHRATLFKRTYASIPNPHQSPLLHSSILRLAAAGSLPEALRLLNSAVAGVGARLPSQPILYAALLQSCTTHSPSPSHGLQLHSRVLKSGLTSDRFVGNSLLSFYFKLCPDISLTRRLFDVLPDRDVVSWTSMVSGYVRAGDPAESLRVFSEMVASGIEPNAFTLSSAVKACSDLADSRRGGCFHGMVLSRGFGSNHVIASSLVDMYGSGSAAEDARRVFDEMLEPDRVCWTSMISALTRSDRFGEALGLFYWMVRRRELGTVLDGHEFGTVLMALGNMGRRKQGKEAHAKVITGGLTGNVVVESSLLDMYAKCGLTGDCRQVFDRMTAKNAVSWSALLGGYCQNGNYEAVVDLFRKMDRGRDDYSFSTVLRACAGLGAVNPGKEVHCQFLRSRGWRDVIVESALVDLYAKCGLIDYGFRVFTNTSVRSLITWNAMISGFAQNGRGMDAVNLFDEMLREGKRPDNISFLGVIFACSHSGLVEEGKRYFKSMTEDYGIEPEVEHCTCMVDLLGRVGLLGEAEDLIQQSVYRDESSLWAALLGACATFMDPEVAERVAKKMIELEPCSHLSYVLLANVYRTVGRWDEAIEIRRQMKAKGVRKDAGKSWIEVKSGISAHPFKKTKSCKNGFKGLRIGN